MPRPDPNAADLLAGALRHHQAGRLGEAERLYRQVLAADPHHADGLHLLGVIAYQAGRHQMAAALIGRAIAVNPEAAVYHSNLGNALKDMGRPDEAVASYRAALRLQPDYPEAYSNLGLALQEQGQPDQAIACFRKSIGLRPDLPETHNNMGASFRYRGQMDDALICYRLALALNPEYPEAHNNLGDMLREIGKLDIADHCLRRSITVKSDFPKAHLNLGNTLKNRGDLEKAASCYCKSLILRPDDQEAYNNLGIVFKDLGRPAEAVSCFNRAIALKPDYFEAQSNLILSLHYAFGRGAGEILAQARRFGGLFEDVVGPGGHPNARDPDRRLRVGYVSADLRSHPVGYFLVGALEAHDRAAVEVTCYSNSVVADAMTARLRAASGRWRSLVGVSDADAARMIRADGIDLLVDLSGHTGKNRLPLFALRPAPVQVSWLGYFGTTGLPAIDCIIADRYVVPPGEEGYFTERVWRLEGCYLCYSPHRLEIAVGPFPGLTQGFVTFGCFNNRAKITAETVAAWARILGRVGGSRLFIKTKSLADEGCRAALLAQFADHGISGERLILEGHSPLSEALAAYNRVDIALDPFPFGGGTTTAETLWMGVPLVCLQGTRWTGRMSQSILATLDLTDWVAKDVDHYVETACRLAGDLARLAGLRAGLRRRLERSSFCDGPHFTRGLEDAYRGMWRAWCAGVEIRQP